jgi:hypothetical protein
MPRSYQSKIVTTNFTSSDSPRMSFPDSTFPLCGLCRRSMPARPLAAMRLSRCAARRVAAHVAAILRFAFLDDAINHAIGKIVPVDKALANCLEEDADLA